MTQLFSPLIILVSIIYLFFLYFQYKYENTNIIFSDSIHKQSIIFKNIWKIYYRDGKLNEYRDLIEKTRFHESNTFSKLLLNGDNESNSSIESIDEIDALKSNNREKSSWRIRTIWLKENGLFDYVNHNELKKRLSSQNGFDIKMIESSRVENIIYNPEKNPLHLYTCILYLHGGGWIFNSPRTYERFGRLLSEFTGFNVFIPNYRKAPEFPHPYPLNDVIQTVKFLKERGYTNFIIMGDSAGGALTANLLHVYYNNIISSEDDTIDWLKEISIESTILFYPALFYAPLKPDAYASYRGYRGKHSPFIDLSLGLDMWFAHKCHNETCEKEKFSDMEYFAPLNVPLNKKLYQLFPKSLIIISESDVLHDDGVEFYKRLVDSENITANEKKSKHHIIDVRNSFHGFMTNDNFPFSRKVQIVQSLVTFLKTS